MYIPEEMDPWRRPQDVSFEGSFSQGLFAQGGELARLGATERGSETLVDLQDPRVDLLQESHALIRDTGDRESTVFVGSTALHEPFPFQPVQQSCYVRGTIDEPLGDRVPGVSLRVSAPEDPQDVVLVVRDAVGDADLVQGPGNVPGGHQ